MSSESTSVRCPKCAALVSVPPDWRLAICPQCGGVVTRMEIDSTYD
ncbi:MAG: hypothetical protein ACRECT_00880 [Thermoplasmata archaeon]